MSKETFRKIYNKKDAERQEKLLHSIRTLYIPKQEFKKVYKLLADLDFLDIKTNHPLYGIQELIEDFNTVTSQTDSSSNLPEERIQVLQIIRDALVLSVNILEKNPDQLVIQLLGRLMYFTQPEIVRLVQQVENHPAPYLVPRSSVLLPPTQKLVRTLQGNEDSRVTVLITVPFTQEFEQSFLIVSGGEDRLIKVWDGLSGDLYQTLENHGDSITALSSTQDGKYIFSGSVNGDLIIWQVNLIDEQKIEIKPLYDQVLSHDDAVKSLVISADQKLLFVASGQKIYVYGWQSNNLVVTLKGHIGVINCLLCDQKNLYSGSDDGLIYIWDMQNYQHIGTLKPKPERNEGYRQRMAGKLNSVLSMCFVDYSNITAIFRDGLVHEFGIFNRETRNYPLPNISYEDFYNVANGYIYSFSKYDLVDNDLAIAAGNSFAVDDSKEIFRSNKSNRYNSVHNNLVSAFCISPDGKYAISGEKEIKIWRINNAIENEIVVTPAHNKPITHIQIVPDKNICISASDGFLRVWNLSLLAEVWDDNVYHLKDIILPQDDSDYFVTLSMDETTVFKVFNTDNGVLILNDKWDSCNLSTMIPQYVSDHRVIFGFRMFKIGFYYTIFAHKKSTQLLKESHLSRISCLAVSPLIIASGSDDSTIQLVDVLGNKATIYLKDKSISKFVAFVYSFFRLLAWLSDDLIVIYGGSIYQNSSHSDLDRLNLFSNSIFETKGRGYQIPNSEEYIIPISKERRMSAIYRQDEYDSRASIIDVIDLKFGEALYRIMVEVPNLVSWQFDVDFDTNDRYLIGIYDDSLSKSVSTPLVAKNLVVWDLWRKKKCCEFVNDLEITSYRMSSKLESVIVGDAGGRLHFLQFTSEDTESINLYLHRILNPEYLAALKSRDTELTNLHLDDSEYQKALKNMIDLDSYEATTFIQKYYDMDRIYAESYGSFFKSIFHLVKFDFPQSIGHIKLFWSGMKFASSMTEIFEKENIKNAEIVISYDPNNYEAYWIKGKIYLKQAKSFFEKKLYKEGMKAASKAREILNKADTLSEKSSKVNNAIYGQMMEAKELDYKCFFWHPVTKMSELFDEPLETESDFRYALKLVNMKIDNISGYSRFASIPNLLPKAYIYQAKLNLLLGNDTEALEICNLALKIKPINDDTQIIYGIMADAYEMQNNHKLARKYRRQSKSIGGSNSGRILWESLWAWGEQWENDPNLDDRVKFFLVKIVTPIRVYSFYLTAFAVMYYPLMQLVYKTGMDSVINRGFINIYEYISHQRCIEVYEAKKMIYCFYK